MPSVTIAVDLAKSVFQLVVADESGRISERKRLSRPQFLRFWENRAPCRVLMEACGSAHFWGRFLQARGFNVVLLPAHSVTPYVQRGKTDERDAEGLLEAVKSPRVHPVAIKSCDQQAILALHRARQQWQGTRTARINAMRGFLREFGVVCAKGSGTFLRARPLLLEEHREALPGRLRTLLREMQEEVLQMERRMEAVEKELEAIARQNATVASLLRVPGVGVLTATAMYASIGNIHLFRSARHLASWLGITPKEHSTGSKRRLGRISKQGDTYLRTLLIHGARSALCAALERQSKGRELSYLQRWAVERADTMHLNKASVALANKMARIIWALWTRERTYDGDFVPQAA